MRAERRHLTGMLRTSAILTVAVVFAMVAASGCSDGSNPGGGAASTIPGEGSNNGTESADSTPFEYMPTEATPAGTYAVGTSETTYTDDTRPTVAHGDRPEIPSRTLRTVVVYPTGKGSGSDDPTPVAGAEPLLGHWPMIVFAHGSTRKAEDYMATLAWWASAGYVVIAPNFPLSTEGTPGGTLYSDYPSQTADESFLIDAVLADENGPLHLADIVHPDRIGLGGQSFGAITTLGTVAARCCADPRIRAATEFAGMFLPYPSGADLGENASQVPVLFVHGDDDPTVPYAADHEFWTTLGAPGGFLTIVGGGHDDGYFAGGSQPLDRLVAEVTLAFYDTHLKNDDTGTRRMTDLIDDAGDGVVRFEPSA